MTKQFTTPCYVRIEDKGKRKEVCEQLHPVGYKIKVDYTEDINPIVVASKLGILYDASQFEDVPGFIDCGINIPIFLALAAMNDSDDKDQLFINDKYKDIGCTMYHVESTKKFNKYLVEWEDGLTDLRCDFRKATVPEIIEHFKTKEK